MPRETVALSTADGPCQTGVFTPEGAGPWPAVLFLMDAPGPRPALFDMAERLTRHGYLVLLPDLYHRSPEPYTPQSIRDLMRTPEGERAWRTLYFDKAMAPASFQTDLRAMLDFLSTRSDVRPSDVGVTGYCMGGNLAIRAAGLAPERVVAAASFHGGYLATDSAASPHLLAPRMKAQVYVACADNDRSCPDDMKQRLDEALSAAGVVHTVETYAGARHGFAVPGNPTYDEAASERHWKALLALFERTLRPRA
ncbi:dienelactone hydrolase family protein [Corallococcus sp. M34]|uniref:dienelactone hydrolase family protein n=1 Tax=Citreicoccus inhibens TaxID=2849499 RepID=UPI001C250273|nr:dienelactone hydrolase family protein [Citreicoccus inhibens]MBU8895316.1 dienelactone hydrolase family protein [Citreicoccus inhibens]